MINIWTAVVSRWCHSVFSGDFECLFADKHLKNPDASILSIDVISKSEELSCRICRISSGKQSWGNIHQHLGCI